MLYYFSVLKRLCKLSDMVKGKFAIYRVVYLVPNIDVFPKIDPPSCGKLSLLSIIREIMLIPLFRSPDAPIQVKCPQQSCPVYLSQVPQLPPPAPSPHHILLHSHSSSLFANRSRLSSDSSRVTLSDKETCRECPGRKQFFSNDFSLTLRLDRSQNVYNILLTYSPPPLSLSL